MTHAPVIVQGDNLEVLAALPDGCVALVYLDPPFNTGKRQARKRMRVERDEVSGQRVGFGGRRYTVKEEPSASYADQFDDYLGFMEPRLREAYRVLHPEGSLFLHIDYREVHYIKVALDGIFGRDCFQNEIIWAYDYGARSKRRWSAKHDNLLWYTKHPKRYTFHYEAMDRIPYMAPGLVGPEKAARGKTPTDVWWHTIVSPTGKERTGYPTQKPLGVLRRILEVHSSPGDLVVDPFSGSGTTAAAAIELGRRPLAIDSEPDAIAIMAERLAPHGGRVLEDWPQDLLPALGL